MKQVWKKSYCIWEGVSDFTTNLTTLSWSHGLYMCFSLISIFFALLLELGQEGKLKDILRIFCPWIFQELKINQIEMMRARW